MKKFIGAALLLPIAVWSCTNNEALDVPDHVQAAFAQKFPQHSGAEWELDKGNNEVNFKQDGVAWSATFTPDAVWTETEHNIAADQLPEPVSVAINGRFANQAITEAEVAEGPNGTVYEVKLMHDGKEVEVVCTADGTIREVEDKEPHEDEQDEQH